MTSGGVALIILASAVALVLVMNWKRIKKVAFKMDGKKIEGSAEMASPAGSPKADPSPVPVTPQPEPQPSLKPANSFKAESNGGDIAQVEGGIQAGGDVVINSRLSK